MMKTRYKRKREGLEKAIDFIPPAVDKELVYPQDKTATIKRCDDEKLVIDHSSINYIYLGLGVLSFLILYFGRSFTKDDINSYPILLQALFYTVQYGFLFLALKSVLASKKVFVFNRKDGTLTYPEFIWLTRKTVPFSEACFIKCRVGPYGGEGEHLAIVRADGVTRSIICWDMPDKYFSLFVWYMDKNRPLPPGTAFDPYREKDYARRKAEGLPAPLYDSSIKTPEQEGAKKVKQHAYTIKKQKYEL